MIGFKEYLTELKVTIQQLIQLEKTLDALFRKIGMDVSFTKHFLDRINDDRNGEQIKVREIRDLFRKEFAKYKDAFKGMDDGYQALLKDIETNVNIPFVIRWDERNKEFDIVAKTVMRKKNFKTSNKQFKV